MKQFSFIPHRDRHTLWCLLIGFVAVAVIVAEWLTDHGTDEKAEMVMTAEPKGEKPYAVAERTTVLQPFDPNTADSTLLLSLGLQPWQVRSIYKYRAAGGAYTCPEDFARLYGLTRKKYMELRPYIRIGKDYRPAREMVDAMRRNDQKRTDGTAVNGDADMPKPRNLDVQKIKVGETIDLNTADTTALKSVPGIGSYFARKIVYCRDMLGGYVSKDQLQELISNFPEHSMPFLTIQNRSAIARLNVNTATEKQLSRHPYITYKMAKEIVSYRRLRGSIKNLSELQLLPSFTKQVTEKLKDYIEY